MSKIQALLDQLNQKRGNVPERRKLWLEEKKDFVFKKLLSLSEEFKGDWHVNFSEIYKNHGTVYIAFNNRASGIFDINDKALIYKGGGLFFSLFVNGKVCVWLEYPYIDEILYHNPKHKDLIVCEPSDIDDDFVIKYVELFISEMVNAENQDRNIIGFKK